MTLKFVLLVVDDNPDGILGALAGLRDHLTARGFALSIVDESADFSDAALSKLAHAGGRDYDLVMIDYNLGLPDRDGASVARRLRAQLRYTEMLFYSSDPTVALLGELAKQRVSGIFVASREELDAELLGLADTLIRKTVDLNHMRGLAMAEVAEMDLLMEQTLQRALGSGHDLPRDVGQRVSGTLFESIEHDLGWLTRCRDEGRVADVVSNGKLFSVARKYQLVRSIGKRLGARPSAELKALTSFAAEILDRRNMLAHAKEVTTDGRTVLRSIKAGEGNVDIDDPWMEQFRRDLAKHKPALAALCRAIALQVGGGDS